MNTGGAILIIIALLTACGAVIAVDSTEVDTACYQVINTPEQALAWTYEWTGFEEIKKIPPDQAVRVARVITAKDTRIPYLYKWADGRRVWEIKLDSIFLVMPDWIPEYVAMYNPKNFVVLLDSATGQFIMAYTQYDGPKTQPPQEPTGELVTAKMRRAGKMWTGFCECPPPIKLMTALNGAIGSNPPAAKVITAVCIIDGLQEPKVVWSILGRGLPRPEPIGPPPGDRASSNEAEDPCMSRMRTMVDAYTGRPISVSTAHDTSPIPDSTEYKRK